MKQIGRVREFIKSDYYGYSGAIAEDDDRFELNGFKFHKPLIVEYEDEDNTENEVDLVITCTDFDGDPYNIQLHIMEGEKSLFYTKHYNNYDLAKEDFDLLVKEICKRKFNDTYRLAALNGMHLSI